MVGSTNLRAATSALPVINDARQVVLDAFVDAHCNSEDTFASQGLQVSRKKMVVSSEAIDLKRLGGVWFLGVFALSRFVHVRVV